MVTACHGLERVDVCHREPHSLVLGQLLSSDLTRKLIDNRIGDLMPGDGESGISERDAAGDLVARDLRRMGCCGAHPNLQSSLTILPVLPPEQGKQRRCTSAQATVDGFAGWAPYLSCDGRNMRRQERSVAGSVDVQCAWSL